MWARIRYEYKTGEVMELEVGSEEPSYPDAVSECVAGVLRMYAAAMVDEAT